MELPLKITDKAYLKLLQYKSILNIADDQAVRIGSKGMSGGKAVFLVAFDTPEPNDVIYQYKALKIIVKITHQMYLAGLTVDYKDNETEKGFVFE